MTQPDVYIVIPVLINFLGVVANITVGIEPGPATITILPGVGNSIRPISYQFTIPVSIPLIANIIG
ncbi:unnamed protein product [marine sediment metagenome]|uniref:Uncharacterized protein n=1 Tax=marine sediment metagenome TaxID=412755 RepID=X1T4Q0_9ZZZZ